MFKYFHNDVTRYLDDDLRKKVGKLFDIYIYDDSKVVHCCEITPSYECYQVGFCTVNVIDDDTYDELMEAEAGADEVGYFHCHSIEHNSHPISGLPDPADYEEEEYLEEVLEYCRCNIGAVGG